MQPQWNETLGTELYDHGPDDNVSDIAEAENVVANPDYAAEVVRLSVLLHAGWRGSAGRED